MTKSPPQLFPATHGEQGRYLLRDEKLYRFSPHRYLGHPRIEGNAKVGFLKVGAFLLDEVVVRTEHKLSNDLNGKIQERRTH
jgi:hypothetical protein